MGALRSIHAKLMALVVLCTLPMAIAVAFLIDRGVGKDLRFAGREMAGNAYQRPLLELVTALRRLDLLVIAGEAEQARDAAAQVEPVMAAALTADLVHAETLRLTPDAIAADGRDVTPLASLRRQWPALAAPLARAESVDRAALESLIQAARRLALVAGDTSNLILDPDLDSYYLMDLTNLAIPDAIARLGRIGALRSEVTAGVVSGAQAQIALGALAALVDEVDRSRVGASARSALAEDERFYGASRSLALRLPRAVARYDAAAEGLVTRLRAAAADPLVTAPLHDAALEALDASNELWKTASEELDVLLVRRMDAYRRARVLGLALAFAGLAAAIFAGRRIARAIVRSVERARTMAEQVAAGDLAGARRAPASGVANDETGALVRSLTAMAAQLAGVVSEVVASAAAVSEASEHLEAKTADLQDRARSQKRAVADATEITCEVSLASDHAIDHGVRLLEAAETTRGSMSEIESQASSIEAEMELLASVVAQLLGSMEQMTANARSIASSTDSLRAAGDETVHSVEDLRRSISSIEQCAVTSLHDARAMLASSEQGEGATRDSMAANQEILDAFATLRTATEQLQARSVRIEKMLAVIDGVADEVGLLSLNASIIAAQSGEHGRSFAIVANEIGELARETESSSGEIARSVDELQQDIAGVSRAVASGMDQVQRGFDRAQEAAHALRGLAERARASAARAREIAEAADAQSVSVGAVERSASAVHGGVIEIGGSVVEYSAAVASVRDLVTGVDGMAKSVLVAAERQTAESATVSQAMRELIERARTLELAAVRQREATGRMGSSIGVFRSGADGTDDLVSELGRVVEILRERSTALSREVTRFRV